MALSVIPDVVIEICHHCVPTAQALPRQWNQGGALVVSHELPCSGKIDIQYLLRALGEVRGGLCVVACPRGQCRLAQGNLRAEIRVGTLHRLLAEIGLEPERVELLHCNSRATAESLAASARAAVERLAALGPNPAVGTAVRPGFVGPQTPRSSVGVISASRLAPSAAQVPATHSGQY